MNDIMVHLIDMPPNVKGLVRPTQEGDYHIFLNAIYNHAQLVETYNHEVRHLLLGHHYLEGGDVAELERQADAKATLVRKIRQAGQQGIPLVNAILQSPDIPSAKPPAACLPHIPQASCAQARRLQKFRRGMLTNTWY